MFDIPGRMQCRKCGNDMRAHTAETTHQVVYWEFRCVDASCGHMVEFEEPRVRPARREKVEQLRAS